MLLPCSGEISILWLMSLFSPRFFGVIACGLLIGNAGCVLAQPYPHQQVYRHASATTQIRPKVTQEQPLPQPIQQTAYAAGSQPSQSGSELYQPWNLDEFPVRSGEGTPYRLVSDSQPTTQETQQKTPPPASGLQNLLAPKTTQTQTSQAPANRSLPLLGIGRDVVNEFKPSNERNWAQNHAVLQTAEFNGNMVTIRNVRYSRYETAEDYTTQYYNATFNLDDIRTLDLVMVPFQGLTRIAHVESSFGFADGRQIGLSIEARYEEGEQYDPAAAAMRQFELIYVFADERDMIRLATDVNKNEVYIYRLKFEPGEVRIMFVDALQRANKLAAKPEFYHPLTNSCVTNLITHINKGAPKAVPREYRTLMPGLLDSYMYDLKLVATSAKTFKETREMAKVNWLVERYGDLEYFSAGIRQNMY